MSTQSILKPIPSILNQLKVTLNSQDIIIADENEIFHKRVNESYL